MKRTICKTDDEEEVKRLLNNLEPYLRNKVRPILFRVGEKDYIRSETIATISQMMTKSKATSSLAPRTSEVSVSGDTMQIDQTNVTINIDDTNPFEGSKKNEPHTEDIEEQLRQIVEGKRLLEKREKENRRGQA